MPKRIAVQIVKSKSSGSPYAGSEVFAPFSDGELIQVETYFDRYDQTYEFRLFWLEDAEI